MKKRMFIVGLVVLAGMVPCIAAQEMGLPKQIIMGKERVKERKEIHMPKVEGYTLLKCDFHVHTIFSDGIVWPSLRIREAWEEGLDVIALTDHVEGQPSRNGIETDLNLAYENARDEAQKDNIILIKGAEISRMMPPGHLNVLFVKDVNALRKKDIIDVLEEAKKQGAFIFWNHPGWNVNKIQWYDLHEKLYQKGLINGIEVFNEFEWYPQALKWANEKGLTLFANTDIHDVVERLYDKNSVRHRPMTLVMVKERTEEAVKNALENRRTLLFFYDTLIGKKEYLESFFKGAVQMETDNFTPTTVYWQINNLSDVPFTLKRQSDNKAYPEIISIPACSSIRLEIPKSEVGNVHYQITNLIYGPSQALEVTLF